MMTGGLTGEAAARRLAEVGPNEIAQQKARSPWAMLLAQFASPLIWVLSVLFLLRYAFLSGE